MNTASAAFALSLCMMAGPIQAAAQTLARPGWVGSGLTAQAWFKHAIFYQIDTRTFQNSDKNGTGDLKGITQHIDYIHSLGADAILLEPLAAAANTIPSSPIDPALGTLEDFDNLTLHASQLKIRILLELPSPDPALARFWLTRGVAGFYIPASSSANAAALQAIRKLLPTYVGQRILITDADLSAPSSSRASVNELVLDRAILKAGAAGSPAPAVVSDLRHALDQSQALLHTATPIFAMPSAGILDSGFTRAFLTAILLNHSASLITAGQELGLTPPNSNPAPMPWGVIAPAAPEEKLEPPKAAAPAPPGPAVPDKYTPYVPYVRPVAPKKVAPPDPNTVAGQEAIPASLLNFYRRLSLLHHGSTAIHDGEEITLDHDAQSALIWVRKPTSSSQFNSPVVIACNLSDKPVVLSLAPDMARFQLRGKFLRTLLRSDDAMGGTSIDRLTIPANGVYVGQLRY